MTTAPETTMGINYVVLAGGGGGARLVDGLAQIVPPDDLTIIGNTGDDFVHMGLHISPDMDTLLYTLAGVTNQETGWGRAGETWHALDAVRALGGPDWFSLGDIDLGTHLTRTHLLAQGMTLTAVTAQFCAKLGVQPCLLPMADSTVATLIETPDGMLPFQEWFVKERWQPEVVRVHLPDTARTTRQAATAVEKADVVIIAPSNPFLSIDPILNAYPLQPIIADNCPVVIAVSPIIGGDAVKGPTAKMLRDWNMAVSSATVAAYYSELLTGFIYDIRDAGAMPTRDNLMTVTTDTWMRNRADRVRLARDVVAFATQQLEMS